MARKLHKGFLPRVVCIAFFLVLFIIIFYKTPNNKSPTSDDIVLLNKVIKSANDFVKLHSEPIYGTGQPFSDKVRYVNKHNKSRLAFALKRYETNNHKTNWDQSDPIDWFKLLQTINSSTKFTPRNIHLLDTFEWWNFNGTLESCPIPNLHKYCQFTENDENIIKSDVVIAVRDMFHEAEINESELENVKIVYYSLESPHTSEIRITNNSFLASYWRGSDFWVPYYKWEDFGTSAYEVKNTTLPLPNYAEGKTKLAAMVVSNCIPANDRMFYVRQLQKFIPVDVYGWCGDFPCSRSSTFEESCFPEISKSYKFYLAFENANCRDYITEKLFFNALQLNMVPVVLGAHRQDYEDLAPKNSFIHVEDFESPEEMSMYLKELDENDQLYNEYFKWKHFNLGRIVSTSFLCEVCAMIQYSGLIENKLKSRLKSGFVWSYNNEQLCLRNNIWYWDRPLIVDE